MAPTSLKAAPLLQSPLRPALLVLWLHPSIDARANVPNASLQSAGSALDSSLRTFHSLHRDFRRRQDYYAVQCPRNNSIVHDALKQNNQGGLPSGMRQHRIVPHYSSVGPARCDILSECSGRVCAACTRLTPAAIAFHWPSADISAGPSSDCLAFREGCHSPSSHIWITPRARVTAPGRDRSGIPWSAMPSPLS